MTYRRAAIPAVVGGLLLTALLWWAGASESALRLQGSTDVLGAQAAADLERWLAPWSYDPPASSQLGAAVGGVGDTFRSDSSRYLSLYSTALQIRFAAVLAFFVPGALLLVRRLPPVRGRLTAALLAVWAWGVVAGTLAVTVSAPWLIASQGHGSYRFLPQLAGVISSGRQVLVATALVAAVATVLVARVTAKGAGPLPQEVVPARAARLAATAGTAVIALSLVVLSYQSVAATLQTAFSGGGLLSEPGDLLRQWLLLGAWAGPAGTPLGDWLLYRALDVALLAVVWWSLRLLPGLLTRAGVPALAVGAVCATVLGLLTSQFLRMLVDGTQLRWDLTVAAGFGDGIPAALTWGLVAGVTTALTLRMAVARTRTTDPS
ncbi:hypothetical protein OG920_04130 [Streptomyces europaeiscabiei]|uniref:hypothetical protein n=1 Tax=Streptomyces TaxID=1883 RepID=UPI000A3A212C|nr:MULTISPECIES: hypothetical protein [Streptomyces]MDX3582255.1 hypothetical protein [Streptomyces europaeiscabiei]MDX3618665.1 hypothetical protein [Streptomyces europaeiscabiei]MDX3630681.1 hypothetical protein [Streptomyces europaeiscabiei]MDX3648818.1 hypothetical protein [Streptomyces europaeiscabiei]WUD30680.1 hypothetical protein OG858_04190 [Streptomyces europaeiscabiei]